MDARLTGLDLTRVRGLRRLLYSPWVRPMVMAVALGGLVAVVLIGLYGTPVGSRNLSIVGVWIAWWAALILVAVPLLGRGWCSICPIPAPGEWLQRGALLRPGGRGFGLNLRWPRRLRGIWLQNAAFAALAVTSPVVLTQPQVTAWVLLGMLALALIVGLVFERRAFCRHLCPVGGFIGVYAQVAPLELRVRDRAVCAAHTQKTCYTGNREGFGCPWQVFPAGLVRNNACGLCLECLRSCPHDNLALRLRPFGADLAQPRGRRSDESYKSFLMIGSALAYSAVLLGPWAPLKSAAYALGSPAWLAYAAGLLALCFIALPGTFALAVAAGAGPASRHSWRKRGLDLSYALVPLGLALWIAFSLSFVAANFSLIGPALSDPLGRGWDLLGLAGMLWQPVGGTLVPWLQTAVLGGGLAAAVLAARRIAREHSAGGSAERAAFPVAGFALAIALLELWLLVG